MTFKIEAEVPIPAHSSPETKPCPYPFESMNVGDSFEVTCSDIDDYRRKYPAVFAWAKKFRKRNPGKRHFHVMTRRTENGFRVWRSE